MSSLYPDHWPLPKGITARLGETLEHQRTLAAEGHLLFVLHDPPKLGESRRDGFLVWRDAEGGYHTTSGGEGQRRINEALQAYAARLDTLENGLERARTADDLALVSAETDLVCRSLRPFVNALQTGCAALEQAPELVTLRDIAHMIDRAAELLAQRARTALQAKAATASDAVADRLNALEGHLFRLNLMVALFFPLMALAVALGWTISRPPAATLTALYPLLGVGALAGVGFLVWAVLSRKPRRR